VTGFELFILGRNLMKLGEEAMRAEAALAIAARTASRQLPASVRSVLIDAREHPNSSISEITARTGFPQSHVSAAVARLREDGDLVTAADPADRRRTLVGPSSEAPCLPASPDPAPVQRVLATAVAAAGAHEVAEVVSALEGLASRLSPEALGRVRSDPAAHTQPQEERP
jgi:Winged helix DNA-binding domain